MHFVIPFKEYIWQIHGIRFPSTPITHRCPSTFGCWNHFNDVIMGSMASQNTNLTIVYSTVYSNADQRKHQSSASLAFVRGIHRWPVNSPHKWPLTGKMFPFDDVIMPSMIKVGSWGRFSVKMLFHLYFHQKISQLILYYSLYLWDIVIQIQHMI